MSPGLGSLGHCGETSLAMYTLFHVLQPRVAGSQHQELLSLSSGKVALLGTRAKKLILKLIHTGSELIFFALTGCGKGLQGGRPG